MNTLFNQLYLKYSDYVFVTCFKVLRDRRDAEDASQETWIKVWRNIAANRYQEGNTKGWLSVIATNTCRDMLRSRKTNLTLIEEIEGYEYPPPDRIVADRDTIRRALAELKPRDQALMVLILIGGLTYKQAGKKLGISFGQAKVDISRARMKLSGYKQSNIL